MELTGERYVPLMKGVIEYEHLSRYYFVVNQLDLKDKNIVDLASGEGYGTEILSRYAKSVIGIDISSEAVEHAKNRYKKSNLQYLEGDASKIPLEDNFADVFVSFETIEHHNKHDEMLSEIKRILKPNGILIMSSPDKKHYTDIPENYNIYHVKELYYNEFQNLISKYFQNNYFFLQNNISGSAIVSDFVSTGRPEQLIVDIKGKKNTFVPLYNIAVSTDNSDYVPILSQCNCINYQLFTEEEVFLAQQEIRRTDEYRLGKKILKRLKFLRKFL